MSGWIELRVRVAAAAYAGVEALLEDRGALSITQGEGDTEVFGEPGLAGTPAWRHFTVCALFAGDADVAAVVCALRELLGAATPIERLAIADRAWHEVWKQSWQPQLHAAGLCVCPTWCDPPAAARQVIRLDPGGAFGTGAHETTSLCLDWLASSDELRDSRVIDYGCGSGILAIAAALLGARAVAGVDIDAEALEVAGVNVALNACSERIQLGPPEILVPGQADIVLANILQEPLLVLAPRLHELCAEHGVIVLSGLLGSQVAGVLEAYAAGFTMEPAVARGEWVLLAGRKRPT